MISSDQDMLRTTNAMPVAAGSARDIVTTDQPASPPDDGLHLHIYAQRRPGIVRRAIGAIMRPLLTVLTTQAVVTAVLICFVAVVTTQHASQIISEKFSAINAALKRLTP